LTFGAAVLEKQLNRRWTPMDADGPNELVRIGFLRALGVVTMGMARTNPLLIGVHLRPSAVSLPFA
jgi:hypothetical protein